MIKPRREFIAFMSGVASMWLLGLGMGYLCAINGTSLFFPIFFGLLGMVIGTFFISSVRKKKEEQEVEDLLEAVKKSRLVSEQDTKMQ